MWMRSAIARAVLNDCRLEHAAPQKGQIPLSLNDDIETYLNERQPTLTWPVISDMDVPEEV
jgi:hypothetical protein